MTDPSHPRPGTAWDPPEYSEFWLGKNPTPTERADLIVKGLNNSFGKGGPVNGASHLRSGKNSPLTKLPMPYGTPNGAGAVIIGF